MNKKIVLFSEMDDQSTAKVLRWIIAKKQDVCRINVDDELLSVRYISDSCVVIGTSFGEISISKEDVVWFRRASYYSFFFVEKKDDFQIRIFKLQEQRDAYESVLNWLIIHNSFVANPLYNQSNKIAFLNYAKELSIKHPPWIVTSEKQKVVDFHKIHGNLAYKSFNSLLVQNEKNIDKNITGHLTNKGVMALPDRFNSTIFQKYIDKKYELRIFYWLGNIFSMGIFSQSDSKTTTDFRNYNTQSPNRTFPVEIPNSIKLSIIDISKKLKIDTGSFDIIVTPQDEFYFLEVNPVGQFGMVSYPCNYYIEQFIADNLIKML